MFSRRIFLCGLAASAFALATTVDGLAAGGGGGNGGGGGDGGGGNGGGGGNSGGNAGGNGNASGNANPGGNNSQNGKAKGKSKTAVPSVESATNVSLATSKLRIRHKNGFEEILSGGRYHMKDNQGRTIVDRPATKTDLARLQQLTGL